MTTVMMPVRLDTPIQCQHRFLILAEAGYSWAIIWCSECGTIERCEGQNSEDCSLSRVTSRLVPESAKAFRAEGEGI